MEVSIFPKPSVSAQKSKFVEARLHSDTKDPVLQKRIAGLVETVAKTGAQPIYVAMDPNTEAEMARFNGAALSASLQADFVAFLEAMAARI